ncbi:hypothetical protein NFI96_009531 [Prochilodus magdalenae]|nr:hypothetical protein NFI96_009531 [Prochilodus magdalenae]
MRLNLFMCSGTVMYKQDIEVLNQSIVDPCCCSSSSNNNEKNRITHQSATLLILLSVVVLMLPCGLGEPGVNLGCLPSDRLVFDHNTTTEESKLLNKHFFDCPNPEPGVPIFVIEDMVSGRSDKFLGSYTFKVVGGGTSREHPELQRSGSSSV